jgi:SAM-dependent methyltransferase
MLEDHLGGHNGITHLDYGALDWLIATFRPSTFLDIGCGPGGMVELAEQRGLDSLGVDGDHTLERYNADRFVIHDFTLGPATHPAVDLGWSCEFVEHVYEKYQENYMQSFQKCRVLMLTYAPPGHTGYHHVNLQPEEYWIKKLEQHGLKYHPEYTQELRAHSTMGNKKKHRFVKNRGLIFINE